MASLAGLFAHDSCFSYGQSPRIDHGHDVRLIVGEFRRKQPIHHQRQPVFDRRVIGLAEVRREERVLHAGRADIGEHALPGELSRCRRA